MTLGRTPKICRAGVAFTAKCNHGYRRIARFAWIAKLPNLRKYLI